MPLKVKSYGAKDVEDFLSSPCFSFLKVSRELDPLRRDGVQLDVRVKPNALPYIKAELLVTNSEFFTGSEFGIPTQTLPDGKNCLILYLNCVLVSHSSYTSFDLNYCWRS